MKNTLVYFKAVLSMLFWALTFVWIKIAFQEGYRPYEIVYLRLIFASILLFGVMLFSGKWEKLSPRDMGRLALVSFSEPFAYFVGEANGLQYVSSTLGSLIISLIPIVTAVGAWLFLKEKAGKLLIIGLLVSTGGVVVMSLGSSDLHATLKGVLFLLVAVFAGMSYGLLVKRLTHSYSALTIVAWQNVFGLMFFTPLFLYYDFGHFTMMPQSGLGLLTICAMSLFASVGAFLLYTALHRSDQGSGGDPQQRLHQSDPGLYRGSGISYIGRFADAEDYLGLGSYHRRSDAFAVSRPQVIASAGVAKIRRSGMDSA